MTPDFPALAPLFAQHLHQMRTVLGPSLHQWEALLQGWIPRHLLAQEDEGHHSRNRCWNLRLVFWTFLWQVAQAGSSCREAIRHAQNLCRLHQRPIPADSTSPFCQARSQLPLERLDQIHQAVVSEAQAGLSASDLWCGLHVYAVDGTTLTAPDTPENQKAFPQHRGQRAGCGFPLIRLVAFFALATGLITGWVTGAWGQHELALLQKLWDHLRPGDLLLGDRGFCTWGLLAQCQTRQIHAVFRGRGCRRIDFRRGQRLGPNERLVQWRKPACRPVTFTPQQWKHLPQSLTLRMVRCRLQVPGLRTRQICLVTTLLDRQTYPLEQLALLYLRRWRMELAFRHLKITLQMDQLSCKTPQNLAREIRFHLLVHNLTRRVMIEAARRHRVALERLSFAGALAACRRCGETLLQARSQHKRRQLRDELFRAISADEVPLRPGRREPRAVKRRPKSYPRLTRPRRTYRPFQIQNSKFVPRFH